MTDVELTKACAMAMGADAWTDINGRWYCYVRGQEAIFDPIHDDAQAMALVKKLTLRIQKTGSQWNAWKDHGFIRPPELGRSADLNCAICECVARMP